ncbi:MAG: hypothetical protein NTZ37_00050 [Methanoregula sp.]|nr:hypothetical protein [Methanoregula sp.]
MSINTFKMFRPDNSSPSNRYWIDRVHKKRTIRSNTSTVTEIRLESSQTGQILMYFSPSISGTTTFDASTVILENGQISQYDEDMFCALASEVSLADGWLSPEEDEAWADL